VIQTQRIGAVGAILELVDWHTEDELYASDGPVLQLFRVNTFLKTKPALGLPVGAALREFCLE